MGWAFPDGAGFVAISLDNYTDPHAALSEGPDVFAQGQGFFQDIQEIADATDWLHSEARWINGVLCFGHVATWDFTSAPPALQMSNLVHLISLGRSDDEVAYFNAFFEEHAELFQRNWQQFGGAASNPIL